MALEKERTPLVTEPVEGDGLGSETGGGVKVGVRWGINAHKALTPVVILVLMIVCDNWHATACTYLGLHGSYCVLWLIKDYSAPDKSFATPKPIKHAITAFLTCDLLYWTFGAVIVLGGKDVPNLRLTAAIALHTIGVGLMLMSDTQKYFTLKFKTGLIRDHYFARTRNPNYLGENMLYLTYALLANSWITWAVWFVQLSGFVALMRKKDESLRKKDGADEYFSRSWLFIPKP